VNSGSCRWCPARNHPDESQQNLRSERFRPANPTPFAGQAGGHAIAFDGRQRFRGDGEEQFVAKHRKPSSRGASSARQPGRHRQQSSPLVLVGTTATAAALSTILVLGHATNTTADSPQVELAAATIGIGGRGDPGSVNIPHKLQGNVVPPGYSYIPVPYPAGFDIDNSVNAGVPVLAGAIASNVNDSEGHPQLLLIVGYSEGTIVAEKVRRTLDPSDPGAPSTDNLQFVMIASPNVPNGGIFARFPGLKIPFIVTSNGAAAPSQYDTTYVTNEYDPYADFPAYFNPLSLANSLMAVVYVHPDVNYDSVDYDPVTGAAGSNILVKKVTHTVDGTDVTDTYVFVPAEHLPLFGPVRQIAGIVHLTPLTEPLLDSIEPLVRVFVDMGYTDRQNLNPEKPVQFSLITPPGKVVEAAAATPGAIGQGVTSLVTGVGSLPSSIPSPLTTNSPSINAKSAPQEAPAEDTPPPDPSGSTTPPVTTLSDSGPSLEVVTDDGGKSTPVTPAKPKTPKKNVFTQLAENFKGFFSPKKKPVTTKPDTKPDTTSTDSTPNDAGAQGQSGEASSDAA
jgi:hypothetical protein